MSTGQQLRWREPWFFSLRMRNRSGWKRKGWIIAAVFVAMMAGWYLDQRYGKGLRIGLSGAILLCLGIAVFVGFLNDLTVSEVQAGDEGVARAVYGHGVGAALYRYQDMLGFSFVPPAASGKPFGLLILTVRAGVVVLGVPDHLSQSRLTEFFQNHGVHELQTPNLQGGADGWQPSNSEANPASGAVAPRGSS
ncbi:MAG TPA: hypothetical protein VN673_10155 [Clostridia bacterium]|nr:hypothetical protein [Clostridia bacterium]